MAKVVYIGFPSPLVNASCSSVDSGEKVDVEQVQRGVCQDISVMPEKKGKYKLELEFDYDPAVLSNISNLSISSTQPQSTPDAQAGPTDISSFDLNIPGLSVTPNEDGSISFSIPTSDGQTTEVNANIPGMNVVKKDDGSVTFSMPEGSAPASSAPVQTSRTTKTTTTTITTNVPVTEQKRVVAGEMTIPRSQNISIKLPCPKQHQDNLKSSCTDPNGAPVPVKCTPHDENTILLEFAPAGGNGTYALNLMIGDAVFPGCPINLEVKGL